MNDLNIFKINIGRREYLKKKYLPFQCSGAFLIPYFTNLAFTGLPLFFFELSLGQYASSSPIALWRVIPLFQGSCFAGNIKKN